MDNSTLSALSSALDFGSKRLEALSNNLSNINTPGYKRKDVSFQSMLDAANGGDTALQLSTDDPRQLTLSDVGEQPHPEIVTESNGSMRPDGNNVDVDAESARLAQAQIYYSGAAQMIEGQFAAIKSVIKGE